jgi:hypothetical protein
LFSGSLKDMVDGALPVRGTGIGYPELAGRKIMRPEVCASRPESKTVRSPFGRGISMGTQLHDVTSTEQPGGGYPDDWWSSRSTDELREMINRGFAGGDLFTGATAEARRRSNEAQRAADEEAAAAAVRRRAKSRKILILRILVALSLLATLTTTLVVFMHLDE